MNPSGQRQSSIWSSSSSAKQIYALGEVEKDIARLLHIAATALSLLTVPQADPVDNSNGEQLPDEATKYYETLESVQKGLRKAIVNLREARISSAAIAPSSVQATLLAPGVNTEGLPGGENLHYALQESLVESEAWAALAQTIEALQTQTL
ncbi:hypothetical protein RhiXN_04449 [Rhizoctonia solani]|uniref:Mediator of RNA polymerase II transcription subunit 11 n=1 Tax=Rhizoctonia solani TaxID=456999 RepID=A0A8H8NQC8_9AGAM|nr:uncharacterized protein RhiXN_04449 [Rhizoctonia solani]QRW16448.1 hypothetical protein RhiXN_04449 [Rhizoctonia solani]